jgi:hypothetical protein
MFDSNHPLYDPCSRDNGGCRKRHGARMSTNPELTVKQKKVAKALRAQRPMCVPGTNAIISAAEAKDWHDKVATAAVALNASPEQTASFCDACGVAE